MANLVGQTVSHYRILEHLGGGGMGVVYKAQDLKLDRPVALKFLPPDLTRDPEAKERLIHEAKAASTLQHNNICTVHEIDETPEGQLFIAMDLYEGETLKKKLEHGPLEIEEVANLALQIAQGLTKAHEHGIVHRDIKPANIMLTTDGVAKIVDFGLAKFTGGTRLTKVGSTLGTAAYMSPEQVQGLEVDSRSDVWQLGVVLYELLTGALPFRADHEAAMMYQILNNAFTPVAEHRSDVPANMRAIIEKALQKNPALRYSTMADFARDLASLLSRGSDARRPVRLTALLQRKVVAIPLLVCMIGLGSLTFWWIRENNRATWAREEALPHLTRLIENEEFYEALLLGEQVEKFIPNDPILSGLFRRSSRYARFSSQPPGARASTNTYGPSDRAWTVIGQTPIDSIRIPRRFFRLRIEKDGFIPLFLACDWSSLNGISFKLDRLKAIPEGMVRVPAGEALLDMPGLEQTAATHLGEYLIDKYEVTNRQYKLFVDAGGYHRREYWRQPFVKDGRPILWEEAMALLKDKTGRYGPSSWEVGTYAEGLDNHPVTGVSWYEAAAYAEFAGKTLPTVFHWTWAVNMLSAPFIVPLSNFGNRGPAPVGKYQGLGAYGTYDMAGNAREWCWNQCGEQRFILGGGWDDPSYVFTEGYTQTSFDRHQTNGFRCITWLEKGSDSVVARAPLTRLFRDYTRERPVSDQTFGIYLSLYSYDRKPLTAVVDNIDSTAEWFRQKISFDAAYGNERVPVHLFLPRTGSPPFQTVVFFPGSDALFQHSSDAMQLSLINFIVQSGRAVLYPVYKGTYERNEGIPESDPNETATYRDWIIQISKDLGRSLDYLETRKDINNDRLAYYGFSWGGRLGFLLVAVDKRFKASINYVAGLNFHRALPEVDDLNYVPRVTIPVLMLNGRLDYVFPYVTSQVPMFNMIGTPFAHKRHVVFETGHYVPRVQLIKEVLDWLDLYLGPVR
jgi:eukaryotic-like serine/threonine-protein kinase